MAFNTYSNYYDLFYEDKNYKEECLFLEKLIGLYKHNISTILDLGCGTGGHDFPLEKLGYQVTGVDLSESMIQHATQKQKETKTGINFIHDDIRSVRLGNVFDLVISMFAVMSYQITNDEFQAALNTAREHLEKGHLFIFDTWFGPAVLDQKPETRIKEFNLNGGTILRLAIPQVNILKNTVTVNYKILHLLENRIAEEVNESHEMRYFFAPEISLFAKYSGFKILKTCPFMQPDRQPTEKDWNVTWVLEAV